MIKNDLFLRALKGETVQRPPVWMMRQAGRYLPEFIALRDKYDFFTRCQTPELAAEITVQPIRRIAPDAAILFSDILVVPQAMGIEVLMKESFGPFLPNPIRTIQDVEKVIVPNIQETLGYVMDAVKLTKEMLNDILEYNPDLEKKIIKIQGLIKKYKCRSIYKLILSKIQETQVY